MIRRLLPQAFWPVLALVGTLAPAPAAASLPNWPDRHLLAAELKGETLLPAGSEVEVAAPHVHGAFCPHALRGPKTRVRGFDLGLHCYIGGDAGLTCAARPAYAISSADTASDRGYNAKARYFDPQLGRFLTQDSYLGQIDEPPSLHRYMYANANPLAFVDPTGHYSMREFGQDVKWGLDFGVAFSKEFSSRAGETTANVLTVGGYGGVKRAYAEGRVTATDSMSGAKAYAEGVFNTITLGGGERAVDAYAEGKGAGEITADAARGVRDTVLPISEVKTLFDSSKNAWEKAEAIATGTAKVAGLVAGGLAAKNAIIQRLANKPGLVTESAAAGADASLAPVEGALPPAQPPTTVLNVPNRGELLRAKFGSIPPGKLHARINAERGLVGLRETLRPSGSRFYEAGFEARLANTQYPGVSAQRHFQQANQQLFEAMKADPAWATSMERLYPGLMKGVSPGARGKFPRRPPTAQLTWHHNPRREGVLELVPYRTHIAPGPVQQSLHPEGEGVSWVSQIENCIPSSDGRCSRVPYL